MNARDKRALKKLLRRMQEEPDVVLGEAKDTWQRWEREALEAERDRKEHEGAAKRLVDDFVRDLAENPAAAVRLVGIAGQALFDKLERRRRTK